MTYPGILINEFSTPGIKTPGFYEGGALPPAITQKRVAADAKIYPGLFVGRASDDFNYDYVKDVSQISAPTVNDIKGIVGKMNTQEVTTNFTFSYDKLDSLFYPVDTNIQLVTTIRSRIYALVGESFDPTASTERGRVFIAPATVTTPGSEVWAGSIVSSTYTDALEISTIASFSFAGTAAAVTKGDLIPLVLDQLSA